MSEYQQLEWDKFTVSLNFNDKTIYNFNRHLLHKTLSITPLCTPDSQKIFDDHAKTDLFANTMEWKFTNNLGFNLQEDTELIYELNHITKYSNDFVTPKEIWHIVCKLLLRKAFGYNILTNTAL